MSYKKIFIERYNNGERNFSKERTLFDQFQISEAFGEEVAFEMSQQFAKLANIDLNEYADLTFVEINEDAIEDELNDLKFELLDQLDVVGADDDQYDYIPDLVYAFEQICRELNAIDFYNRVIEEVNEKLNYEEEDELYYSSI